MKLLRNIVFLFLLSMTAVQLSAMEAADNKPKSTQQTDIKTLLPERQKEEAKKWKKARKDNPIQTDLWWIGIKNFKTNVCLYPRWYAKRAAFVIVVVAAGVFLYRTYCCDDQDTDEEEFDENAA